MVVPLGQEGEPRLGVPVKLTAGRHGQGVRPEPSEGGVAAVANLEDSSAPGRLSAPRVTLHRLASRAEAWQPDSATWRGSGAPEDHRMAERAGKA